MRKAHPEVFSKIMECGEVKFNGLSVGGSFSRTKLGINRLNAIKNYEDVGIHSKSFGIFIELLPPNRIQSSIDHLWQKDMTRKSYPNFLRQMDTL